MAWTLQELPLICALRIRAVLLTFITTFCYSGLVLSPLYGYDLACREPFSGNRQCCTPPRFDLLCMSLSNVLHVDAYNLQQFLHTQIISAYYIFLTCSCAISHTSVEARPVSDPCIQHGHPSTSAWTTRWYMPVRHAHTSLPRL